MRAEDVPLASTSVDDRSFTSACFDFLASLLIVVTQNFSALSQAN